MNNPLDLFAWKVRSERKRQHLTQKQLAERLGMNPRTIIDLEELSEAEMAQLAVYDRYPWEYTTFPVGGAVILIEDDGLAEALLGLSQEDREIFMMHWFLRMTDAQIARYINMPRRTVNTRRHKAYRLLTELMGGEADD